MTLFEYLTAGFVLILSFAVVRGLSGFPHVLDQKSRYWVHLGWLVFALLTCLIGFWAFFSYRDANWTLPRFALILAIPAVLFVYNSILVPSDPAGVDSWRAHYYSVRKMFCITGLLTVFLITCNNVLILNVQFSPMSIGLTCVWAGVYLVGLASERHAVHTVLVLLQLACGTLQFIMLAGPAPLNSVGQ